MSATNVSLAYPTNGQSAIACSSVSIPQLASSFGLLGLLTAVHPILGGWGLSGVFTLALLAASWIDTKTRLIPNRLTYPLILFAFGTNGLMSLIGQVDRSGVVGFSASLEGAGACFALMLLLFLSGATGGGDVKLATAIGAVLGPQSALMALAWCHLLAGLAALVWIVCRLDWWRLIADARRYVWICTMAGKLQPIRLSSTGQQRMPMAAFFALGVFITQLGYRLW